jgi:hypothetical protein
MHRIAFLAALSSLAIAGQPTRAAPPTDEAAAMHDFFAGTLEIDVPAGNWSAKRYYAPDHSYRETGADGEVRGTWAIEDGKICVAPAKALGDERAAKYCNLGLGKHLGEAWRDNDPVTGNLVLFRLTAGRS